MVKEVNNRPSILIIYTGGTIRMVQKPQTGTLAPVKFDEILSEFPELNKFNFNTQLFSDIFSGQE